MHRPGFGQPGGFAVETVGLMIQHASVLLLIRENRLDLEYTFSRPDRTDLVVFAESGALSPRIVVFPEDWITKILQPAATARIIKPAILGD